MTQKAAPASQRKTASKLSQALSFVLFLLISSFCFSQDVSGNDQPKSDITRRLRTIPEVTVKTIR